MLNLLEYFLEIRRIFDRQYWSGKWKETGRKGERERHLVSRVSAMVRKLAKLMNICDILTLFFQDKNLNKQKKVSKI